jgi:2,4-dienoyl-CoA reductase-like NADH-dependent reductase (Old Yellow Enzyme family)
VNPVAAHVAFAPAQLGPLTLRNRIVKAATFEGMCPGGVPTDALTEFHRRTAAGGVGMTTVAYCAVSADGRSYDTQMRMVPALVPRLRTLTDAVHGEGALASLQLGHCGSFADRKVIGGRPLSASVVFNTYGLSWSRAMTEPQMARVTDDFVRAATLSAEAGFDAVELHLGHGYLLSQFLSPHTNRRKDAYGGELAGRARFPREVVRRVREALPSDRAVLVKMNLTDGFASGLGVEEAAQVAVMLEEDGADALVLSGGFVSKTPLYMLRGNVPLKAMLQVQKGWFRKLGLALFGRIFVPHHPFDPLFFLEEAKAVRAAVKMPLVLLGGIKDRAHVDQAMADGFDFVGMGRALIHDPDAVRNMAEEDTWRSECVPCNRCIAEMDRGGVRCVLGDLSEPLRIH